MSLTVTTLLLIQMTVALEARGEPIVCQNLIMDVVMNRVVDPKWPNTLRGVLSQKNQFPWWKNRKAMYKKVPEIVKTDIAVRFMNYWPRYTEYRYFYNPKKSTVDPKKSAKYTLTCGHHVFKAEGPGYLD